jgi:hypothetical protein
LKVKGLGEDYAGNQRKNVEREKKWLNVRGPKGKAATLEG